ncbi:MAG: Uncharacterised protein [Bacteroidota bacterium]|nr:MAG: Uncharacterised protein [Bacteroidota bacterium]
MKNQLFIFKKTIQTVLCLSAIALTLSCEEAFEYELPEAGTQPDNSLPVANFDYIPDAENFKKINFNNLSFESIKYEWDFGTGTSTDKDPSFVFDAGEGTYPVTLTAIDGNNATNSVTLDVDVVDKFVPLPVTIINGDFNDGQNDWKFSTFTGGTTSPFNSSSDGSFTNYDGTDNGAKTKGAKWTGSTTALPQTSNTRFAYQAIVVSPSNAAIGRTVKYILEYEYAIKTPAEAGNAQAAGGNRIFSEILNQHYADGANAVASEPVSLFVADEIKGKTVHTTVQQEFTANETGEMAIMFYAYTAVDCYIDNVKVYPAD